MLRRIENLSLQRPDDWLRYCNHYTKTANNGDGADEESQSSQPPVTVGKDTVDLGGGLLVVGVLPVRRRCQQVVMLVLSKLRRVAGQRIPLVLVSIRQRLGGRIRFLLRQPSQALQQRKTFKLKGARTLQEPSPRTTSEPQSLVGDSTL